MSLHCILVLMSLCSTVHDRPVMLMAAGAGAAMTADYARTVTMLRSHPDLREGDPITRPFIQHPAAAIPFGIGYALAGAWIAHRMRTSRNSVVRRLWWLPQSVQIGSNVAGALSWEGVR